MIHIFCDSTGAVPAEMLEKHANLHVIPLHIEGPEGKYISEEKTSIQWVIDTSEKEKRSIPTSQPSTGDFLAAFDTVPAGDAILVITVTSGVSGTYNGAVLAARQSGRKQIAVVNSRTTAIGIVQLAEDALEWIEEGVEFEEIVKRMNAAALRMYTTFTVDTLDYLRRGGRIGKAAGLIGSILKIKPVIFLNEKNEVDVLDKVRTSKKAAACMLKFVADHSPCRRIGIVHIENPEGAEDLRARVQAAHPDVPVTVSTGTPVLAAYLGPGLTGIIFESAE